MIHTCCPLLRDKGSLAKLLVGCEQSAYAGSSAANNLQGTWDSHIELLSSRKGSNLPLPVYVTVAAYCKGILTAQEQHPGSQCSSGSWTPLSTLLTAIPCS